MHITHSYLGTALGNYRCQFYLLLKDYIEAESAFCKKLDGSLERFARNMKDKGALVRAFGGDIETTRSHVLEKPWSYAERTEITETPGLLMINVDFDRFDPRQHPWLFISLGEHSDRAIPCAAEFVRILEELSYAVSEAEMDLFQAAHEIVREIPPKKAIKLFEAKPGVFGFKVDLIQGAELVMLKC